MKTLSNKIDFAVVFSVNCSNPNGDPLNGNRPRTNYDGLGEVSDVCIKRKIRNRLMEAGYKIFVQSDDNRMNGDEYRSLHSRAEGELKSKSNDQKAYREEACKKWIDVRAFGQVFPWKAKNKKVKEVEEGQAEKNDDAAVSIGIRGPVSIHSAFSVVSVNVSSIQITKSVNLEGDGTKKGPDTMGMKHRVDHGVYMTFGAINPQLAIKTGFSDEDAQAIKNALEHLFDNDASSARPEGSMEVIMVVWWQHNNPSGQYSSAIVHRTISVTTKDGKTEPKGIDDYSIKLRKLTGLKPEIFNPNNIEIAE
ncbi:MAG: type I-C CRISPR-associated protein Cas7/Csd2 [Acidobacteria bacterium]|nr:type I-C CRISPR-associated protein Cas7/Csd2 [Acidobacteriota bacterium]MBU4306368.1 type I-C CRISPR-associated protein Cas7/Csd2 [Acidobacteriota bacterium]MCG2810180.1 type I-C CRISPR-associated protein Cas7/Csd2 [Candidatus Aminicenantes bacterium]